MKLTIINEDNAVYVDGICRIVDLLKCGIPSNVHALQWNETAGWIEFKDNPDGTKPANEPITVLPDWANSCVTVWNEWTPYVPPIQSQPTTNGTKTA